MKRKHIIIYLGCFLLLVIVPPVLINELYKFKKGYVTVWNGADILLYFGSILGAIATIWALNRTITFSSKQLKYEHYLQKQHGKWSNIESLFISALIHAQPLTLSSIFWSSISNESAMTGFAELQKYKYDAECDFDNIIGNIEDSDLSKVEKILDALREINITNGKQADSLSKLLISFNMMNTSDNYSKGAGMVIICEKAKEILANIGKIHSDNYHALLNLKKECFKMIYQNINDWANQILD